jgi:hypothetical protein
MTKGTKETREKPEMRFEKNFTSRKLLTVGAENVIYLLFGR